MTDSRGSETSARMPFEHDFFISYAHLDDEALITGLRHATGMTARVRISSLAALLVLAGACASAPSTPPSGPQPSPWRANDPVAAPAVVLEEWRKAPNRATCAPMTIGDAGDRARGSTARRANFSGGWGVAWDVRGLPGREPSGAHCDTCGRGVYGIAGAGAEWGSDADNVGAPYRMEWADGEWAGYALEGGTGPNWLATVRVAGQPCIYYVWSFLGREHLELLLRNVRRAQVESP